MTSVWLVRLFPVTVDDGIDVHVSASYLPYFFYPFLISLCALFFLSFSNFVLFFHFLISYDFLRFQKLFATYHKSARDPPVCETLIHIM
jgi:hypothetical protein